MASNQPYNHLAAKAQKFQETAVKVDYLKRLERPRFSIDERLKNFETLRKIIEDYLQGKSPEPTVPCQEEQGLTDLSCLTDDFQELKIWEDMVLDGFYAGIPDFGYDMKLHVRKKENAQLFTPPDWHDNVIHLKPRTQEKRVRHLKTFNRGMYIREGVHFQEVKFLSLELWDLMTVPFDETGIWEATFLYVASHILPRFWHANYDAFEIICCDSNISRHKADSLYLEEKQIMTNIMGTSTRGEYPHLNQPIHNRMIPNVIIDEDIAIVRLAIWGWNGLESLIVEIQKEGDTINIVKSYRHPLEYVENFVVY